MIAPWEDGPDDGAEIERDLEWGDAAVFAPPVRAGHLTPRDVAEHDMFSVVVRMADAQRRLAACTDADERAEIERELELLDVEEHEVLEAMNEVERVEVCGE